MVGVLTSFLTMRQQEELSKVIGPLAEGNEPPKAGRIAVLAIAYHNVGVEYEFLKKFDQSLQSYRKGVEVAERFLGPDHAITVTLRNSCIAARRAIMAKDPHVKLNKLEQRAARQRAAALASGVGGAEERRGGGAVEQRTGEMISPRPDGDDGR